MKEEIYHILTQLGYKILPKYVLKETNDQIIINLLVFAHAAAKHRGRLDLIRKGIIHASSK
jgi:hypothetical protein